MLLENAQKAAVGSADKAEQGEGEEGTRSSSSTPKDVKAKTDASAEHDDQIATTKVDSIEDLFSKDQKDQLEAEKKKLAVKEKPKVSEKISIAQKKVEVKQPPPEAPALPDDTES